MPESGPYGFVRGALSNERPYRDPNTPEYQLAVAACQEPETVAE